MGAARGKRGIGNRLKSTKHHCSSMRTQLQHEELFLRFDQTSWRRHLQAKRHSDTSNSRTHGNGAPTAASSHRFIIVIGALGGADGICQIANEEFGSDSSCRQKRLYIYRPPPPQRGRLIRLTQLTTCRTTCSFFSPSSSSPAAFRVPGPQPHTPLSSLRQHLSDVARFARLVGRKIRAEGLSYVWLGE